MSEEHYTGFTDYGIKLPRQQDVPSEKDDKNPKAAPFVPLVLDLALTVAKLIVLVVGIAVCVVSIFSGAKLWIAVVRGGATILSLGLLLWLVTWQLAHQALEAAIAEFEAKNAKNDFESTVEKQA
jgi:hypothetical protein